MSQILKKALVITLVIATLGVAARLLTGHRDNLFN